VKYVVGHYIDYDGNIEYLENNKRYILPSKKLQEIYIPDGAISVEILSVSCQSIILPSSVIKLNLHCEDINEVVLPVNPELDYFSLTTKTKIKNLNDLVGFNGIVDIWTLKHEDYPYRFRPSVSIILIEADTEYELEGYKEDAKQELQER